MVCYGRYRRHICLKIRTAARSCKTRNVNGIEGLPSKPDKASGLMSNLPSGLTDMFSDDDKRQFTTTKQNVPQREIIKKLSHECSHDDKEASQKVYQEIVNVLRERTGRDRQAVLQDILANLKKSSICSFSCAFEFG
jgi:hypothetical protein